ncbi:MAG: bifunctional sulfur carrier protein/thiazole synthase protein [Synergistetes bacterium ADurb.Bin520]|jgi:sulfur carrier protein|nr:MAG: bifunctional sulfur carrier protein/thiazole synthase protein [Synergistetes bacterium ADurb.Bin520]
MVTVNGEELPWHPGMTVQQVIDAKRYTFRMLAVWVNDVPIPRERFAAHPVADRDRIQVLHMISGG